ncbi:MAG: NAD(P)-binding protein [Cyanobacteria bacterium P01_G01_bin.54]
MRSCLILGAGMTGLIASTVLQQAGVTVTVLDKGRGVGGRLATRRLPHPNGSEGRFDYGLQRFQVSDRRCQTWAEQWQTEGIVIPWPEAQPDAAQPYYRGRLSNRSIAKHLAQALTVHKQTRVVALCWQAGQWLAQTANHQTFAAQSLLLAMPVPQALDLLQASAIALPSELQTRLGAIAYDPCIAVLALLTGPSQIPDAGLACPNEPLAWLACNQKKGISDASAVTLHATPAFSRSHWEAAEGEIAKQLFEAAMPWLGAPVADYDTHWWQYSQPRTVYGDRYLALPTPGPLVIAGDAFAPALPARSTLNLENALLSGMAAATYLLRES